MQFTRASVRWFHFLQLWCGNGYRKISHHLPAKISTVRVRLHRGASPCRAGSSHIARCHQPGGGHASLKMEAPWHPMTLTCHSSNCVYDVFMMYHWDSLRFIEYRRNVRSWSSSPWKVGLLRVVPLGILLVDWHNHKCHTPVRQWSNVEMRRDIGEGSCGDFEVISVRQRRRHVKIFHAYRLPPLSAVRYLSGLPLKARVYHCLPRLFRRFPDVGAGLAQVMFTTNSSDDLWSTRSSKVKTVSVGLFWISVKKGHGLLYLENISSTGADVPGIETLAMAAMDCALTPVWELSVQGKFDWVCK